MRIDVVTIFPRMVAVVHHGGAGTTSAGLRAGVPAVVTPFFGDQPFWGQRVADLGVGPAPIPRRKLDLAVKYGRMLADSVEEVLDLDPVERVRTEVLVLAAQDAQVLLGRAIDRTEKFDPRNASRNLPLQRPHVRVLPPAGKHQSRAVRPPHPQQHAPVSSLSQCCIEFIDIGYRLAIDLFDHVTAL